MTTTDTGIPLDLTSAQVARVAEAAASEIERALMRSGPEGIRAIIESPLLEDPKISASLLLGLMVLISFPANGAERGNKQVATELGLAASTTHRYIHTLVAAGLLEQDPITRQYRRTQPAGPGSKRAHRERSGTNQSKEEP